MSDDYTRKAAKGILGGLVDAKSWPVVDLSELVERDEEMIAEAQRRFDVGFVVEQFGTWAVTDYGLECLEQHYPIAKDRLYEDEPDYGWMFHMADKTWVVMQDFGPALLAARAYHGSRLKGYRRISKRRDARTEISPRLRFAILRRDGYRCQICGATAATGSRLHVDHKHPLAKGGTNDEANLWTLCSDCNQGKGTRPL